MKPESDPLEALVACSRLRFQSGGHPESPQADFLAAEEPLEIRVRGASYAVLMRTPGRERDLVAGFLAAEGLLQGRQDVRAIEPCMDVRSGLPEANIWNVSCAEGVSFDPRSLRQSIVSSSCGLCGVRSLEDLQRQMPSLAGPLPESLSLSSLLRAFEHLRAGQTLFGATGGSHGAALWDPVEDRILDLAEDVGRHNAVDKLLGSRLLADDYPVQQTLCLLLSGRVSFELVQKAALAGIPMLAGVGMPTSLAVQGAEETGQTLLGWVRDAGANLYVGDLRLE